MWLPICHFHVPARSLKVTTLVRLNKNGESGWGTLGDGGFCCLIQHKKVWSSVWFSKAASGSSFYDKPRNTNQVLLFTAREAWKRAMMQASSLTVGCHTCRWESVDLPLDRHESYSFTWPMITQVFATFSWLPAKRTGKVTVWSICNPIACHSRWSRHGMLSLAGRLHMMTLEEECLARTSTGRRCKPDVQCVGFNMLF